MTVVATTARLTIRRLTLDDAPLVLGVLTDPDFVRFVADRGVRTADEARAYIDTRAFGEYARHGFGLYAAVETASREPVGTCGLFRRDGLDDPDIGYALLPAARGRGHAGEAAAAMLVHARALGFDRVTAIIAPENHASRRVIERAGLRFQRLVTLPGGDAPVGLYAIGGELSAGGSVGAGSDAAIVGVSR